MRPAAGQFNRIISSIGKGAIGRVTVALNYAGEVHRNEVVQARGGAAGFPAEKHIAATP